MQDILEIINVKTKVQRNSVKSHKVKQLMEDHSYFWMDSLGNKESFVSSFASVL